MKSIALCKELQRRPTTANDVQRHATTATSCMTCNDGHARRASPRVWSRVVAWRCRAKPGVPNFLPICITHPPVSTCRPRRHSLALCALHPHQQRLKARAMPAAAAAVAAPAAQGKPTQHEPHGEMQTSSRGEVHTSSRG
eukprot:364178-Chlamydomonas_euryale.AAC.2